MLLKNRTLAFWLVTVFMVFSLILLLMGQTMALLDYEFAVRLGLQEDVKQISEFGVQINRGFGAGDTVIYIPLLLISIVGLIFRKKWALITSAAVMGISAYWSTTAIFMFWFLEGVPGYHFTPHGGYWLIMSVYLVFGVGGICYLGLRGERLIT